LLFVENFFFTVQQFIRCRLTVGGSEMASQRQHTYFAYHSLLLKLHSYLAILLELVTLNNSESGGCYSWQLYDHRLVL
jgi:hypothetical protein